MIATLFEISPGPNWFDPKVAVLTTNVAKTMLSVLGGIGGVPSR